MEEKTEEIIEVQESQQVDDEKKWCVYMHTSPLGKRYIGITSQNPPQRRWRNGYGYKGNSYFWNAISLYGWSNFKHEILFEHLTIHEANKKEIELISFYQSNLREFGYNIAPGGDVSNGISEETRKKMKANHADFRGENNPNYGNHKLAGANNPNYGKKMTKEAQEKLHAAAMNAWRGQHHTEESKQKISQNRKPFKHSDETKKKMSIYAKERFADPRNHPRYGTTMSEEQKEKLRKRNNERYKDPTNTPMYGKHLSEEAKEQIRNTRKNNMSGYKMVFCCELDKVFCSIKEAGELLLIDPSSIAKQCKGKGNYCGRHPVTNEPLHWLYVYDQEQKDGTIIQGAITLGYVSEKDVENYLNNLEEGKD